MSVRWVGWRSADFSDTRGPLIMTTGILRGLTVCAGLSWQTTWRWWTFPETTSAFSVRTQRSVAPCFRSKSPPTFGGSR